MRRALKRRALVHFLLAVLFAAPLIALLRVVPNNADRFASKIRFWYDSLEYATVDWRMQFGRKAATDPRLVLLSIDDVSISLDALSPEMIAASRPLSLMHSTNGTFPFPRGVYAEAIERLSNAGASAVAFDLLFPKPSLDDRAFASSLLAHADKVVIGFNFADNATVFSLPAPTLLPSQDSTDQRVGYISFFPDTDGITRCAQYRDNLENLNGIAGADGRTKLYSFAARVAQHAGVEAPDSLLPRPVRFVRQESFPRLSFYQIFDPDAWEKNFNNGAYFKDKLVLIGPARGWSKDAAQTPLGEIDGIEMHLNAVNALLKNDFLVSPSIAFAIAAVAASALLALLLALGIQSIVRRFIAGIVVLAAYAAAAMLIYNGPGWLLPIVAPCSVFCTVLGSGFVYDFALAQFERLRLRMTFERYHSKNVVKYLLDNTESYKQMLAGSRRPVTVLFSDIRGFTTIVESTANSQELVDKLNEYLTAMVACVFHQDGSIGKFMGDGIMAVWGDTPFNAVEKENAVRAVRAALEMIAELRRLNAKWKAEGKPEWQIGIGLNHGPAIVGDFGSQEHRKEFDVLGDAINLGSRLEGLTKEFHCEIILGESVAELVRNEFHLRTVALVQVKGKQQAVRTYTVICEKTQPLFELQQKFLTVYEEGVEAFHAGNFVRACEHLLEAIALSPDDFLAASYLDRAEEYRANPPGADWMGVLVMTRK